MTPINEHTEKAVSVESDESIFLRNRTFRVVLIDRREQDLLTEVSKKRELGSHLPCKDKSSPVGSYCSPEYKVSISIRTHSKSACLVDKHSIVAWVYSLYS